jgi:hypothetical protein
MRRSLPVISDAPDALDLIEIPIPCDVSWSSMPGDDQVRHCGQCRQNVYNVSMLTRAEANRLLRARACLRIYRRPDRTVITSDCRERLRAARKRGLLVFAGTLVIVLWAQLCAQLVGLAGLKRLLDSGHATMGEPVRVPVPGMVAPPVAPVPPPSVQTPPRPLMGAPPPPPPTHRLMGKPAPPPPAKETTKKTQKIVIKGLKA